MRLLDRYGAAAAIALGAALLVVSLAYGARTAGGADVFGYVSQAYLWRDRSLHIARPLIADVPWPQAAESMSPLGYRPGTATTIVPTYSPGVPLLMAAFAALLGTCGPYVVSPLFAALGVWATFVLTRRLTGSVPAGTLAALFVTASPVFVFHALLPMSDVATTVLWAMSLCALTWRGGGAAAAAGICAGAAILARPNLAPLALAGLAGAALWPERGSPATALRRAAVYLLCGVIPAALAVAWLNSSLYGSPMRSGYGETRLLYSWSYLATNVAAYSESLVRTEGLVLVPAAIVVLVGRPRVNWTRILPAVLFCVVVLSSYLFYQPQGGWTFLRFWLPAFPLLFAAAAYGMVSAVTRLRSSASAAVLAGIAVLALARLTPYASGLLVLGEGEDRYAAVAEYVERALPPNAIVFAMQHSGTISFYAGKPTLRYDWFTPDRLEASIAWLHQRGYQPYLVLENWEEADFRKRFGSVAIGRLQLRVLAQYRGGVDVKVYDPLTESTDPGRPFRLVSRHTCAGPSPRWRAHR